MTSWGFTTFRRFCPQVGPGVELQHFPGGEVTSTEHPQQKLYIILVLKPLFLHLISGGPEKAVGEGKPLEGTPDRVPNGSRDNIGAGSLTAGLSSLLREARRYQSRERANMNIPPSPHSSSDETCYPESEGTARLALRGEVLQVPLYPLFHSISEPYSTDRNINSKTRSGQNAMWWETFFSSNEDLKAFLVTVEPVFGQFYRKQDKKGLHPLWHFLPFLFLNQTIIGKMGVDRSILVRETLDNFERKKKFCCFWDKHRSYAKSIVWWKNFFLT